MELFTIIAIVALLIVIFVGIQTAALFLFLRENERLREENEKFQPPFWFDKSAEMRHADFDLDVKYLIT